MTTRTGTRTGSDRAALVERGWIECECGRTRRIPLPSTNAEKVDQTLMLDLYVSGQITSFRMPENPAEHLCDPVWLREQVVALRATVAERTERAEAERAEADSAEAVRLDESVKTHEARTGWIAVDLDGTLAHYDRWRGAEHIGAPIPKMVERVRLWLAAGREVKIFTARVCRAYSDWQDNETAIREWCFEQFGQELEVTAEKDGRMAELWDDRAVGLVMNMGEVAGLPESERRRIAEESLDRLAAAGKV